MRLHLLAGALGLLTAACASSVDTAGAPSFGDAAQGNMAAQIMPATPTAEPPAGSGAQGERAQTRYKTGATESLLPAAASTLNPSSGTN